MDSVAELETLWKYHPAGPDLVSFLQKLSLPLLNRLAVLRRDQQLRWLSPQPWLAEDYLQRLAPHPEGIDWSLELVAGEWLSRPDDQPLTVDQLQARFPQLIGLADHLVRCVQDDSEGRQIDRVLHRYESLYQLGNVQPKLEYALACLEVEQREDGLQQLVLVDLENWPRDVPRPSLQELLQRFPLYAAVALTQPGAMAGSEQPAPAKPANPPADLPTKIDRYNVIRRLGNGAFGIVYLAEDSTTGQQVAIKVPTARAIQQGNVLEEYRREASIAASLRHANILPILNCGETAEFPFYIVTPYIEGGTLAQRLKRETLKDEEPAKLIAAVADGLSYAYRHRVHAHRDIKPANILLDKSNQPLLADFGLALRDRPQSYDSPGTPAYMSPEQAGREGHLVDERSDIYSLGVVFYELLTGDRPYSGRDDAQLREKILSGNFKAPRALDDRIPEELERICLKMMARRKVDRYQYASEVHSDLSDFLDQLPDSQSRGLRDDSTGVEAGVDTSPGDGLDTGTGDDFSRVVLPGLRAFDADNAECFLQLLPGSRVRQNLPEIVDWWKSRLEERRGSQTFRVGGIMGPSGSGKSSLIRAGILPSLDSSVARVCMVATPDHTETELLTAIRQLSDLTLPELSLPETLERIRCGEGLPLGRKLVLVLDQFEQWLQKYRGQVDSELSTAIRQCDGGRVQVVLLVRDEFYSPLRDFLERLDVLFQDHVNFRSVDLFASDHARKVLRLFGIAYGRLPRQETELTVDQAAFLDGAIAGLTEEGKVICVRLALFARMFKDREWTPGILTELGGAAGVGRVFLAETFSNRRAPPAYKQHEAAAKEVLKLLLQRDGAQGGDKSELKGQPRGRRELQQVSGYAARPNDFADLLRILDGDLRLITPVSHRTESLNATPEAALYELTHDYLVPSIREWLRLQQTVEEQILEDRAYRWSVDRVWRQLPSLGEWLRIRFRTNRGRWTAVQQEMMRGADRLHVVRSGLVLAVLAVLLVVLQTVRISSVRDGLAGQIRTAKPTDLTELLAEADVHGAALDERLRPIIEAADRPAADAATKLAAIPARLAVVLRDRSQLAVLEEFLLAGELTYVEAIRTRLRPYADELRPKWLALLRNSQEPESGKPESKGPESREPESREPESREPESREHAGRRFRAALGLVGLDLDQAFRDLTDEDLAFVATQLGTSVPEDQPQLRDLLRPVRRQLIPELVKLFEKESSTALAAVNEQVLATETLLETNELNFSYKVDLARALADFASDDAKVLSRLLAGANEEQMRILYPIIVNVNSETLKQEWHVLTQEQPQKELDAWGRVSLGRRRANAAISLLLQGDREDYFSALRIEDDPESLSQFVDRCRRWGVTPLELLESIDRCASLRGTARGESKHLESRVMYGLLVALGSYRLDEIPSEKHQELFAKLRELYKQDSSAAVHSASGWLLRQWGRSADVAELDEIEVPYVENGEREWFRLRVKVMGKPDYWLGLLPRPAREQWHALTFVVFRKGDYEISVSEYGDEMRTVRFSHDFALCDREVPWGLLQAFAEDDELIQDNEGRGETHPGSGSWYDCMEFCRWLTTAYFGKDEGNQCYMDPSHLERDESGNPRVGRLLIDRKGFRMPTSSEWEAGARSGQRTTYSFGSDVGLLSSYAWYDANSASAGTQPSGLKLPGIGGLHDVHGNVEEWVHDWAIDPAVSIKELTGKNEGGSVLVDPQGPESGQIRVLRGGSWRDVAAFCRTAYRNSGDPALRYSGSGFRLALSPSGDLPPEAVVPAGKSD